MNRTHLINKGLLKFRQLNSLFFSPNGIKNGLAVVLSQKNPIILQGKLMLFFILGSLFLGNGNLFAQFSAPTFSTTAYSFCEGDNLAFTLDNLPDPAGFPGGDVALQITWYLSTSGPASCGTADITDVESVIINSTSHTFTTDHILAHPVEDSSLLMITTSILDPLNAESGQAFIDAQTTCVPINVIPRPVGTIAATDPGITGVCQSDTFKVSFTAMTGTGPYDVTVNGTTFANITSGAILPLLEGVHFTGDTAKIYLTSILDNGDTSSCLSTISLLDSIIGPMVNEIMIIGNLQSSQTICRNDTPVLLTGTGTSVGATSYRWESALSGTGLFTPIVGTDSIHYNPGPLTVDTWFRRVDVANFGGAVCEVPIDTIKITVNQGPNPVITGTVTEICINDAIYLPFNVSGGTGSYTDTTWLTSDNTRATVAADGLITALNSGFSTLRAVVTDTNGCKDTSNTHTVIILPLPVAGAITGANQVCLGDSITLAANPSGGNGGNTIAWLVTNGTGSAAINAGGVLQPISAGTVDVSYAVEDNKTCSSISAFFTVTIDTIPVAIITANDATICQGDMVTFTATGGDAYEFLVNNLSQGVSSASMTFASTTLNHNDQVTVVATNANGCADTSAIITMMVDSIPLATLVADAMNNTAGIGQSVTFSAGGGTIYEFFVNNLSQGAASATATFTTSTLSHLDTVLVEVTDGNTCSDTAMIVMTINDRPIALNDTLVLLEDAFFEIVDVQANDTDPEGDQLTTIIVTGAVHGVNATVNNDSIQYMPDTDFNGLDSIEYWVCDDFNNCSVAKIYITVQSVNDMPMANSDTLRIMEDATISLINILANDTDADGDALKATILTTPSKGIVTTISDSTIAYTPTPDVNGIDVLAYQVCDPQDTCSIGVLVIEITPKNDAPIATVDAITIIEDMSNVLIPVTINDTDIDTGDSLFVTVISPSTSGGIASVIDDTLIVYSPTLNFFGIDTIIYRVCDIANACDTDTVFVTVQSVNEPPVAMDDFLIINEDATNAVVDVQDNDTDGDGDTFTTSIISSTMMADTLNGDSIKVILSADFTGIQVVVYKICDISGLCDTANVTITVLPINDAPIANLDTLVIPQDTTNVGIAPLLNDEDVDDDTLIISMIISPTVANGTATLLGTDSILYTPQPGFSGLDTIRYTVCDTSNLCANGMIVVTVGFVNTPPNAVNDTLTIAEDSGIATINVVLNDSDINGIADILKLTAITTPTNGGTATILGDSSVNYTPLLNFTGTDSLQYTVCDTSMGCTTAWVFFMVTPINDAPIAVNDTVFLAKDTMNAQLTVLTNDQDIEGTALTVTTIGNSSKGAPLTVINNLINYTAPTSFLGVDTITYRITDTGGLMDTALLIVVITDPNNIPPVAYPDDATTIPAIAVNIAVQDNDIEPNGDNLITSIINGPKAGNTAIVLNQDSIRYTSSIAFAGYDTIWYQVCDPSLTCDTSMVIVLVENTLAVSARVILEGAYNRTTLLMHDSLRKLNLLPVIEPYSTWPSLNGAYEFVHKNGGGNEIITNPGTVLSVVGPDAIVDWVYLELLTAADTMPVASRAALIQRDGDIVDVDGVSPVAFELLPNGNYFLSIRHRNHLGVMTKTAQPFSLSTFATLDFTTQGVGSTAAFGTHAMDTIQSRLVLWAGDGNADRKIIYDGIANDRDPVFFDVITDPLNINNNYNHVSFGYYRGDYDMKGTSVYLGSGNDPDVIFFNVFLHPDNSSGSTIFIIREQIPR